MPPRRAAVLRPRSWFVAVALALLGACTVSPTNGTTTGGAVIGRSFLFEGYHSEPGNLIRLEVMTSPGANPNNAASWVQFAVATTGNAPLSVNSDDPLYHWSVNAAPVPNAAAAPRWPQGGLVRIRARDATPVDNAPNGGVLTTFDAITWNDCLEEQLDAGASWQAIGTACAGVANTTAAFVSTTNVPTNPQLGFLTRKGIGSIAETNQYYAAIDAPDTLDEFKTRYGFVGTEIQATYYNDGDLGLGREMHCKGFPSTNGLGVACYVTNYSGLDGVASFTQPTATALADAVARTGEFATVAMVYDPPLATANSVKFIVYDADGDRATTAQLDEAQDNISIPQNCLSCHGVNSSYSTAANAVSGARFLPFDPDAFVFSAAPGFTRAAQEFELRQLNALVTLTEPTAATSEFIAGLYAPKLVTDPTAVSNSQWVPAAWLALPGEDGRAIYNGVIKKNCRTCHVSASTASLDFAQPADFSSNKALIRNATCGPAHGMPHAERVMRKFWQSSARAYLVTGYPSGVYPDATAGCAP